MQDFTIASAPSFIGKKLITTDWLTITQDQVNGFAEATLDPDWMHVTAFRCGFKMDWPLKLALMEQPEVALSQKLPVNYTRPPATWMIASLMHVDENWRDVQSELRALSNWYGVEADLSPVKRYMELNHTLVAKISADGVVLRSVAPGQLSGRP